MADSIEAAIARLRRGDWKGAHGLVQQDESKFGAWAHGIVHLLEGDEGNARYWYRRAGRAFPPAHDTASEIEVLAREWNESRR